VFQSIGGGADLCCFYKLIPFELLCVLKCLIWPYLIIIYSQKAGISTARSFFSEKPHLIKEYSRHKNIVKKCPAQYTQVFIFGLIFKNTTLFQVSNPEF
jgi:hypothetical protein